MHFFNERMFGESIEKFSIAASVCKLVRYAPNLANTGFKKKNPKLNLLSTSNNGEASHKFPGSSLSPRPLQACGSQLTGVSTWVTLFIAPPGSLLDLVGI